MKKQSKEREGFNFYKSYYTVLEMLNDNEKLEFLLGLFNKQFYNIEPVLSDKVRMVYLSQQHSINKQVEGWEFKTKNKLSGEPPIQGPTEGGSQGSTNQVLEQVQVLEKGKEKEKVEVEERNLELKVYKLPQPTNKQLEDFAGMFFQFNENEDEFDNFLEYWFKELNETDQRESVVFARNFIKYNQSKNKKVKLEYYLMDKKWKWETIRTFNTSYLYSK